MFERTTIEYMRRNSSHKYRMKWQRHLSGVGIGVRILSLQIGISVAADLDGVDHVMVQGSNSGSISDASSH